MLPKMLAEGLFVGNQPDHSGNRKQQEANDQEYSAIFRIENGILIPTGVIENRGGDIAANNNAHNGQKIFAK